MGTWKRFTCGHIIITTRRKQKEVEESLFVKAPFCISLSVFDIQEAIEFVKNRTGNVIDENEGQSIEVLVKELGGLPLALEQASAHIKCIRCSCTDYIEQFKKKRLKLLKSARPAFITNDKRLAVTTTWQLNIDYINQQSEHEGLGKSAVTVMNVTSFLFADDIPKDIINIGKPIIEDKEIVDVLDNGTGLSQVMEILTRFSLFQSAHAESLSVHRLVQEVIRDSMNEQQKKAILQKAIRMVNFALNATSSPYTILYEEKNHVNRGSLLMWSKIAANANVLRRYLVHLNSDMKDGLDLCFNLETINILQTTALFHSLHQRQDMALADQQQMLLIMATLDIDKKDYQRLTTIKIPLFQQERKKIQDSIATCITDKEYSNGQYDNTSLLPHETLRTLGNEAFKKEKYQEALQYYSEAIRECVDNIDCKILSNRSLVYLRLKEYTKALQDANRCINLDRLCWKAYCWKCYAIFGLIDAGILPDNMKSVGLASACIAASINESCIVDINKKLNCLIYYKSVDHSANLGDEIMSMTDKPYLTLILKSGRYIIDSPLMTTKSVQVIGIEDGVEIDTGPGFQICLPPKALLPTDTCLEQTIHVYFENVLFVSGGAQIAVTSNGIATFYKCKFSNGQIGCEDFPKCKGERGCVNPQSCRLALKAKACALMGNVRTGEVGYAGIGAFDGGIAYIESCVLYRCGGGGVLSLGDGSLIEIKNCTVRNMRQMGIEARNGGTITATNSVITRNQFHGVAIGPKGIGYLNGNTIQCNGGEGIFCCCEIEESSTHGKMNSKSASKAIITENVISQNGLSGLSFDGGVFEVKGNKIFDNWLWGFMIKSKSSCYILNNDIFENKCGGIYIGYNYSASVFIDGNTIRDHTGPDVYAIDSVLAEQSKENLLLHQLSSFTVEETMLYSRPPIITCTNIRRNNNKGFQHNRLQEEFITTCCFCHEPFQKLQTCSTCKKAKYCSKECQSNHWRRHKHMCKLLRESFIVEVKMKYTIPMTGLENEFLAWKMCDSSLKGIREGLPPDKKSTKPFIVKIQTGQEYSYNDKCDKLLLYDQSVTLKMFFNNPIVYHLVNECGVLARNMFTTKEIFYLASFKENGDILCIQTW